jgi:hypothetical protein
MTEVQRRAFSERLDGAIDETQAALRPLFGTVRRRRVSSARCRARLLHEIMFMLGMLVIIHCDEIARNVHSRWLDTLLIRCRVARLMTAWRPDSLATPTAFGYCRCRSSDALHGRRLNPSPSNEKNRAGKQESTNRLALY